MEIESIYKVGSRARVIVCYDVNQIQLVNCRIKYFSDKFCLRANKKGIVSFLKSNRSSECTGNSGFDRQELN